MFDSNEVVREEVTREVVVQLREGDSVRVTRRESVEALKERDRRRAEGGNFTFTDMDAMQRLAVEVDATQLGYLFVLQTFVDYDTNVLVIGRDRRPMTKEDIQKTLNVNRHTLRAFLVEMELFSVIFQDVEGRYFINNEYIFRGVLGNRTRVVKTFDKVARNLYEVTQSARKVKQLGYLVKTLPYLHMYNNVICANPFETDAEKILAFDKGQIAELLGVDEKTMYRIIRTLQIEEDVVFAEVIRGQHRFYMVNPYICSRGEIDKGIKSLFKIVRQPWYRKQAIKKAKEKASRENE